MSVFVDPRIVPDPPFRGTVRAPAADQQEVAGLVEAISEGRLYDVERWIQGGTPLQFIYPEDRRKCPKSPMQAAIRTGQHDVVLLLLCNGYRPDLERRSPYSEALRRREHGIVRLLFAWNVDATTAETHEVASCYDKALVEEFWRRGLDFGCDHELAGALAYATSNRHLYGFMKRNCQRDLVLQRELDRGLCMAVDEENEKAVNLCVWAGADPWAPIDDWHHDEEDTELWQSAIERAVSWGRTHLLKPLKLGTRDGDIQSLYEHVWDADAYAALAEVEPTEDHNPLIRGALSRLGMGHPFESRSERLLKRMFTSGGRLTELDGYVCRRLQRYLLGVSEWQARDIVRLLKDPENVDEGVFLQIIHSPSLVDRHREFGISVGSLDKLADLPTTSKGVIAAMRRQEKARRRRR